MSKLCPDVKSAIQYSAHQLYLMSRSVKTEKWQGKETNDNHLMDELLFHSFRCPMPATQKELQKQTCADQPWADAHFDERVSGIPYNPPPSHTIWPYRGKADNAEHLENGKFTHTYPERLWPDSAMGIRYDMGNLNDVVNLLGREPYTRQAFIPIWFPEDTGVCHGGRVPCTIGYHMIRRHNFLHCIYYIRSCDFIRHFRNDVYLTVRLVQWLINELGGMRGGAIWEDVTPGYLDMHISSLHCFSNEREMLKKWF